jgi:hypothetical protein
MTMNSHCQPCSPDAVHAEQTAGHRAGDHHRNRLGQDEQPEDLAAMAHREPLGDVVQNAGEEPRLRRAEQKRIT